jgi:hypothetical protein
VQLTKPRFDRQDLIPSAHVKARKNSFFLNPIKHQVEQPVEEPNRKSEIKVKPANNEDLNDIMVKRKQQFFRNFNAQSGRPIIASAVEAVINKHQRNE